MTAPQPDGRAALPRACSRTSGPTAAALFAAIAAMIVGGLADAALVKLTGPLVNELFVQRNREPRDPAPARRRRRVPGERPGELHLRLLHAVGEQQGDPRPARARCSPTCCACRRAYFDEVTTARLVSRFTHDVTQIASASTSVLADAGARHA